MGVAYNGGRFYVGGNEMKIDTALVLVTVLGVAKGAWASDAAPISPPLIRVEAEAAEDTLAVTTGRPISFALALPEAITWSEVNIGSWLIRGPSRQESIGAKGLTARGRRLEYTFQESGAYLVALSVGPATAKNQSDSWQRVDHCTKLCVRANAGTGEAAGAGRVLKDPGMTAKVGQRFEIVPLVSPLDLHVGSWLPVRAFFDFDKLVDAPIIAVRPDGSTDAQTTDAVGAANFSITQAGRWMIRFEKKLDGETRVSELVFHVPAADNAKGGNP